MYSVETHLITFNQLGSNKSDLKGLFATFFKYFFIFGGVGNISAPAGDKRKSFRKLFKLCSDVRELLLPAIIFTGETML